MRRFLSLTFGLALGLCSACLEEPETRESGAPDLGESDADIIGGTGCEDWVAASTVRILVQGYRSGSPANFTDCTGVVIAPNVVLTAQHCVAEAGPPGTYSPSDCDPSGQPDGSYFSDVSLSNVYIYQRVGVAPVAAAYDAWVPSRYQCNGDFVVLILDREIPGARIAGVRSMPASQKEGLVAAGFGVTSAGGTGAFACLQAPVAVTHDYLSPGSVRDYNGLHYQGVGEFMATQGTCSGDSGGPLFDPVTREVVGLTSRGRADCTGDGIFSDVALQHDLIMQVAAGAGTMSNPPPLPARDSLGYDIATFWTAYTGGACAADVDCRASECGNDVACPARYTFAFQGRLGDATSPVTKPYLANARSPALIQTFSGDFRGETGALYRAASLRGAPIFWLHGGMYTTYEDELDGIWGCLGWPISNATAYDEPGQPPRNNLARLVTFEHGTLRYEPHRWATWNGLPIWPDPYYSPECDGPQTHTQVVPITDGAYDAWQDPMGMVFTGGTEADLSMNADVWTGLRFPALGIPRGAQLDEAYLEVSDWHEWGGPFYNELSITVYAATDIAPGPFVGAAGEISAQPHLFSGVDWNDPAAGFTFWHRSPNLAPMLAQLLTSGWSQSSGFSLIIQSYPTNTLYNLAGILTFEGRETPPPCSVGGSCWECAEQPCNRAPRLVLKYSLPKT